MPPYAYFKGKYVPLQDANLNVMTNFIHYGTGVFEGIRGNWNKEKNQLYLFRLKEHYERLLKGCKILNINVALSMDELIEISVNVAAKSGFKEDVYERPVAYPSSEMLGVRVHNLDSDFMNFVFPWGRYIDADRARCVVSSWRFPVEIPRQKLTGLYVTNAMAKTEAIQSGYDEAIMLNANGYVAEGSGENLFMVSKGIMYTPPGTDGILMGITRDTVITIAKNELGLDTVERHIDRIELYSADELFLTGTAAHVTPVSEVDRRKVQDGEIGPVTQKLQKLYADVIMNRVPKYSDWCTPVYKE
jgi:branched-chain amino acid aminotransferase